LFRARSPQAKTTSRASVLNSYHHPTFTSRGVIPKSGALQPDEGSRAEATCEITERTNSKVLAAPQGFEPRYADPESSFLIDRRTQGINGLLHSTKYFIDIA
jgi:hypothetical protein